LHPSYPRSSPAGLREESHFSHPPRGFFHRSRITPAFSSPQGAVRRMLATQHNPSCPEQPYNRASVRTRRGTRVRRAPSKTRNQSRCWSLSFRRSIGPIRRRDGFQRTGLSKSCSQYPRGLRGQCGTRLRLVKRHDEPKIEPTSSTRNALPSRSATSISNRPGAAPPKSDRSTAP
jgi:hypothetical protein